MQIGIVAKKIGLSVDAIRFYERNALVPHASRTAGGFRRFGESEIETLPFIRRVQGLGFARRGPGIPGAETEPRAAMCSGTEATGTKAQPCAS